MNPIKAVSLRATLLAMLSCALPVFAGSAQALTVTDILGREITLDKPVDKVILGEGRFIAAFGILEIEDPVSRIAGTLNEFRTFDPVTFEQYTRIYPQLDTIPTFGQTSADSVSIEQAIALQPDVAIFGVEGHGPSSRSRLILDTLEAAGIPSVFIDFRQKPLENTPKSIEIIGQLLGHEIQAKRFSDFYRQEVARVTDRLGNSPRQCPTVLLEIRVGLGEECCLTLAKGLFADMIEAAGGCNIAKDAFPGVAGVLNLETVIDKSPDIYIGTAVGAPSGSSMYGKGRIILGAGVDQDMAQVSLQEALQRPGIEDLPALHQGRAYGIWHHFYNSPLNIYAFQQFAKWLHPDLFEDLDPEQTLTIMLKPFAPVNLTGTYAVSLTEKTQD